MSQTAVNPDSAMHTPGHFQLLQGPRPGQEDKDNAVEVVRRYKPDGTLVGTLNPNRVECGQLQLCWPTLLLLFPPLVVSLGFIIYYSF